MCPKCGSTHLKIKQEKGVERFMMLWTGKRKYRCHNCFYLFRAPDRRRSYTSDPETTAPAVLRVAGDQTHLSED
jgi:hypothetical protein